MSTQLDQIAKKAQSNPKLRFSSMAHLLTLEFLTETWRQMNRRGASAPAKSANRSPDQS
jgi:hypothetical protein